MANRRQGYGGRSHYNSGPVNPWQGGNIPGGNQFNNGNPSNFISQLSEPQAQLALALSKLLQPQQQVPSLLTMNTINPMRNSGGGGGGYGPSNSFPHRGRGNMHTRRPRPDMKPFNNKMNSRAADFNRRRSHSKKPIQPQRSPNVSKPKKPSSTKAPPKSSEKTTEVKKAGKDEKAEPAPTADSADTSVKESADKSEDVVESKDKKRDWKEEKSMEESEEKEPEKEEKLEEDEVEIIEEEKPEPQPEDKKSDRFHGIAKEHLHCHICQKKMWDGESFEKHMNGRAHQQMSEKVEESYRIKADMMREAIRLAEEKNNIEMDRMKRLGKKTKTQQLSRCAMCDLEFYGQLFIHRKSPSHQRLKQFLHPKCTHCNKEFPTRMEWENHRHSPEHLRKKAEGYKKKGNYEEDDGVMLEDECFIVIDSTESDDVDEPNALLDVTDDLTDVPIQIPPYKPNRAVGLSLISPATGFFCKPCSRFFLTEKSSHQHATSRIHYDAFVNILNEKLAENEEEKKRKANDEDDEGNWKRRKTSNENQDEEESDKKNDNEDGSALYDPMEAICEDEIKEVKAENTNEDVENNPEEEEEEEPFLTTDPNDICLNSTSSKNENILSDEIWNEVDNKLDEILDENNIKEEEEEEEIDELKIEEELNPPIKQSPTRIQRPQRATRGKKN